MTTPEQPEERKSGYYLKYRDFKAIERIIEEINTISKDKDGNDLEEPYIDFNNMRTDEKKILWKVKTVIRNMEAVRLRVNDGEGYQD